MPIPKTPIPETIEDAINLICANLDKKEKTVFRTQIESLHFTLGLYLRNAWGLWSETSPIREDFKKKYKLFGHVDDMSGMIIAGVAAKLRRKSVPKACRAAAKQYRAHWKSFNVDPITGETKIKDTHAQ